MERYQSSFNYSYALGMSIGIELLEHHPEIVLKVCCSSKILPNEYYLKLQRLCQVNQIPLTIDERLIQRLSIKENCYVIAFFRKFQTELTAGNRLILVNFTDEGVLGTVFRTAVSFNFPNIVLINPRVDYFDPRVVRASMGALFSLNILSSADLISYQKANPAYHYYLISKQGEAELKQVSFQEPYALIISDGKCLNSACYQKVYLQKKKDLALSLPSIAALTLYHLSTLAKRKR